jgi:hypothetical protein
MPPLVLFQMVRALSVGGQVVRVVFNAEPKHKSPAASDDALNGSNYQVSVIAGQGQPPQSVGVHPDVIPYPAFGVWSNLEVAVDLQTDRPLVVGLRYRVLVSSAMVAQDGRQLAPPYTWEFDGEARPIVTLQQRGKMGLVDLASDPVGGGIMVDSSGDWTADNGDTVGTRKRCFRRVLTRKGGFAHLQSYGLDYDVKQPATTNRLAGLRSDIQAGLQQEPDVDSVATQVSMDSRGFLTLGMRVKTKQGINVPAVLSVSENGVTVR